VQINADFLQLAWGPWHLKDPFQQLVLILVDGQFTNASTPNKNVIFIDLNTAQAKDLFCLRLD